MQSRFSGAPIAGRQPGIRQAGTVNRTGISVPGDVRKNTAGTGGPERLAGIIGRIMTGLNGIKTDMDIQEIIGDLIGREGDGKYTNNPADSGGPTRWGITETIARAYGYDGDMRTLPRETAEKIYRERYWSGPGFDKVGQICPLIAIKLMDFGVVAGQERSAKQLQRILNVLNRQAKDYPDIAVDGRIGPVTLHALKTFAEKHKQAGGAETIFLMLCGQQSNHFLTLAEKRPKDEAFERGWQINRAFDGVFGKINFPMGQLF